MRCIYSADQQKIDDRFAELELLIFHTHLRFRGVNFLLFKPPERAVMPTREGVAACATPFCKAVG